jgi:prepilin-type N-terminal cleavage/methylation domain-containing protein
VFSRRAVWLLITTGFLLAGFEVVAQRYIAATDAFKAPACSDTDLPNLLGPRSSWPCRFDFVSVLIARRYRMKTRARNHQQGFTMVELLVVIAIVAILYGLLLSDAQKVRKAAVNMEQYPHLAGLAAQIEDFTDAQTTNALTNFSPTRYCPISNGGC